MSGSKPMENVNDYIEHVKSPWGRMFYDLLFIQLDIPETPRLKILDFGSGLGVTADYYAAWHDVTAVEYNAEMIVNRFRENSYTQIHGAVEHIAAFSSNTFDVVICHNVLEYIKDQEPVFAELLRVLKPGGTLSVVKHNQYGKVFHSAVFWNDPGKALSLLKNSTSGNINFIGTQYIYSYKDAAAWSEKYGGTIKRVFGMRAFWALGQNSDVKYNDDWYRNMLELERQAADIDEYKNAAYHNHILIEKRSWTDE
ncbi:MAG: methyltransferase domain-containing protein [Defluviitaleaceae bacterium]|nr:methyltransferase domain-containing protein [Defluviitaleaceae bacterium]MCL2836434.1 methyltransferase domain-containing protein [Defluviitaleaceae bacterium]